MPYRTASVFSAGRSYTVNGVDRMPEPGDRCPGFIAEAGRCWQGVYSNQLQATHCTETPRWTSRWRSPRATVGGRCGVSGTSGRPDGSERVRATTLRNQPNQYLHLG